MTKEEDRETALGIASSATSFGMSAGPYMFTKFMSYTTINQITTTRADAYAMV